MFFLCSWKDWSYVHVRRRNYERWQIWCPRVSEAPMLTLTVGPYSTSPPPPHPSLETFPIFPQLMKMHFMRFSNQEWAGVSIHWTFEKSTGFRYWARWIRTKAICTFYEKNQTRAFFVSLRSDYSGHLKSVHVVSNNNWQVKLVFIGWH